MCCIRLHSDPSGQPSQLYRTVIYLTNQQESRVETTVENEISFHWARFRSFKSKAALSKGSYKQLREDWSPFVERISRHLVSLSVQSLKSLTFPQNILLPQSYHSVFKRAPYNRRVQCKVLLLPCLDIITSDLSRVTFATSTTTLTWWYWQYLIHHSIYYWLQECFRYLLWSSVFTFTIEIDGCIDRQAGEQAASRAERSDTIDIQLRSSI